MYRYILETLFPIPATDRPLLHILEFFHSCSISLLFPSCALRLLTEQDTTGLCFSRTNNNHIITSFFFFKRTPPYTTLHHLTSLLCLFSKSTIHPPHPTPIPSSQEMFPMPDPMPRELPKTLPALDPLAKKQNLAKVDQWPGRTWDGDGDEIWQHHGK